ncbi:hypothetical protein [Leucobacter tenebrionis]|nr:hypothetical protein [Leucobacter tenebrionis]
MQGLREARRAHPWGQISWSTKQAIQVLTGNAADKVTKNAWE